MACRKPNQGNLLLTVPFEKNRMIGLRELLLISVKKQVRLFTISGLQKVDPTRSKAGGFA